MIATLGWRPQWRSRFVQYCCRNFRLYKRSLYQENTFSTRRMTGNQNDSSELMNSSNSLKLHRDLNVRFYQGSIPYV